MKQIVFVNHVYGVGFRSILKEALTFGNTILFTKPLLTPARCSPLYWNYERHLSDAHVIVCFPGHRLRGLPAVHGHLPGNPDAQRPGHPTLSLLRQEADRHAAGRRWQTPQGQLCHDSLSSSVLWNLLGEIAFL
ncbi:hypothetical protein CEXT_405461 [Caerostris extrusa]|uniref:Uncharacterized protein n=1 Tax=Caerostris extrusa TaxID=172846 RepID=A0AAV4NXJ1_CAEEX|nr:hypothetical protein CEXT_405461 [Caerostris extrusa]